uniref:Uncharacterized protein n=1 Tax=Salarias fasciatus TaxID=181472 RepID=A0A672HM77_SALFA
GLRHNSFIHSFKKYQQIASLDKPITQREVCYAIKLLKTETLLTNSFSEQLSPILTKLYAESYTSGRLPPSLSQACITFLLKKGKDPLDFILSVCLEEILPCM